LQGLHAGVTLLLHDGNAAQTAGRKKAILAGLPDLLTAAAEAQLHFVTLRAALRS